MGPEKVRIVGDADRMNVAEYRVIFTDDNVRNCGYNCLPNPVIISVDVNA